MENKKLQNLFKLSSRVTVYIPSTTDVNKDVDTSSYIDECASLLSELFGGATSTPALGYWLSQSAGLIKEKSTMVFAYCSDNDLASGIDELVNFCEKIKTELKQEAVALEINGEMYFI